MWIHDKSIDVCVWCVFLIYSCHFMMQKPFGSSGNRSKEPLSLCEGEKSTEPFLPPACTVASDIDNKVDNVQEEEDNAVKRKVL